MRDALHVEGAGQAAQHRRALQQRDLRARLGQDVRGLEARRPAADHHHARAQRRSRRAARSPPRSPGTPAPAVSRTRRRSARAARTPRARAERRALQPGRLGPEPPGLASRSRCTRTSRPAPAARARTRSSRSSATSSGANRRARPRTRAPADAVHVLARSPALAQHASSPGAPTLDVAAHVVLPVEEVAPHQQVVLARRHAVPPGEEPARGPGRRAAQGVGDDARRVRRPGAGSTRCRRAGAGRGAPAPRAATFHTTSGTARSHQRQRRPAAQRGARDVEGGGDAERQDREQAVEAAVRERAARPPVAGARVDVGHEQRAAPASGRASAGRRRSSGRKPR